MKEKKERFVGFVNINEEEYPFEFFKNEFELRVYLRTPEEAEEHFFDSFLPILWEEEKKNAWINNIEIKGKTVEGDFIIFGTIDNPKNDHGFLIYKINWAFVSETEDFKFEEVGLEGKEIDYFLPPSSVYRYKTEDDLQARATKSEILDCGKYEIDGDTVSITVNTYPILHFQSNKPFEAKSIMYIRFGNAKNHNYAKKRIMVALQFFRYVTYRKNINMENIVLFNYKDGHRQKSGQLLIPKEKVDTDEGVSRRIINYSILENHVSKIFEAIEKEEIRFNHLCESNEQRRHYTIPRFIMILARFEREAENIYGDMVRSETRKEMNLIVIQLIEDYIKQESISGKKKKKLTSIINMIEHSGVSGDDRIEQALNDCKEIIKDDINRRYNKSEEFFEEIVDGISERMGIIRNGIAHEKMDLKIEAINLADISIIEELTYVIRLKYIGLSNEAIKEAINRLF